MKVLLYNHIHGQSTIQVLSDSGTELLRVEAPSDSSRITFPIASPQAMIAGAYALSSYGTGPYEYNYEEPKPPSADSLKTIDAIEGIRKFLETPWLKSEEPATKPLRLCFNCAHFHTCPSIEDAGNMANRMFGHPRETFLPGTRYFDFVGNIVEILAQHCAAYQE